MIKVVPTITYKVMDTKTINQTRPSPYSFWNILPIAILTIFFEQYNILGTGFLFFFIWLFLVGLGIYSLTRGIKQRFLWWISLAPFALRGPNFFDMTLGITDIFGLFILVEFFMLFCLRKIHIRNWPTVMQIILPIMLLIATGLSIFFSPLSQPSFGPLLRFCFIIFVYFLAIFTFDKEEDVALVMKAIGFQLVMHGVLVASEYFFQDEQVLFVEWLGLLGDNPRLISSNVTAIAIMISLPFLCLFKAIQRLKLFPLILLIGSVLMIFTMSRMGYLALILDSILFIALFKRSLKRKYWLWFIIFLLASPALGALIYDIYRTRIEPYRVSSNIERFVAAESAIEGFLKYPMTGTGFGQWIRIHELGIGDKMHYFFHEKIGRTVSRNPHNTFLRVALDIGLIGFLVFTIFFIQNVKIVIQFFQKYKIGHSENKVPSLCLMIVFFNLCLGMLLGDYLESLQFWSVCLLIAIVYKNIVLPSKMYVYTRKDYARASSFLLN